MCHRQTAVGALSLDQVSDGNQKLKHGGLEHVSPWMTVYQIYFKLCVKIVINFFVMDC